MKTYLKFAMALMLGGTLFYTACQKSGSKPSSVTTQSAVTKPVSNSDVSLQVVVNLSKALSGSVGGINLNKSLNPKSMVASYPAQTYSLCGFAADSVLNYYVNDGDTVKSHTTGNAHFIFDCKDGQPDGYTAFDTTLTVGTAAKYSFIYNIDQYYRIYVCGCGMLTVSGNQVANIDLTLNNDPIHAIAKNTYTLNSLIIDLNKNSDITSGTADFTSVGTNSSGAWNLKGTITYIGNHQAKVTVNGNTVTVDISTGKVI